MAVALMLLILGVVFVRGTVGLFHRCPPNNGNFTDFYNHCSCTKSQQTTVNVTCQGINTDETLLTSLTKLRNYTIDSLTIKNSGPLTLGVNIFRKLNIHQLVFQEVNFHVAPVFRAFTGLEFTLEELHFVRCNVSLWAWGNGRHFIHLETLRFEDTWLPDTLDDAAFRHFPNKIRKLKINRCSIRRLGDRAFQRLSHLENLELNRNGITAIKRSMFPPHARRLKLISLRANPLQSIAVDTFVNMTRLEFLFLSETRMTSLSEEIFHPVWDQLEEIYFNDIHLNCDCDSKWMLNVPNFKTFRAPYCDSHRKSLDELSSSERNQLCRSRRTRG